MVTFKLCSLLTLALLSNAHPTSSPEHTDLFVKTNFFSIRGISWPNETSVRFFGGIPYAEPPVGSNRFRPPVTKKPVNKTIDASWFGPSCIQYSNGAATVYSEYLTGFLLSPGQQQSEDCLTLNIWAPRGTKREDKQLKPVMIWIHGGGFTSGGSASPYKYGHRLAKDQDLIVVAINYRLNIFGYPDAAALNGENLNPGLMDHRKAIEWVYQNIHAFGGNADQMILFGQSAGGAAVDKYNYAYPNDPLVKGFIVQSGTSSMANQIDPTGSNFTYVASQVGCTSSDKDEEFLCMQSADAGTIIAVYNKYNATLNGNLGLSFQPAPDNMTDFSNYADRRSRGLFSKVPTVYSSVDNEGASLVAYKPAGPNQTAVDALTRSIATCPGAAAALSRKAFNVPVWRTRYFGEWPNLNPLPWLHAYHSSDIPMIFGTSNLHGLDTAAEIAMSKVYQNAWAAFARDPENALDTLGWPRYDPEGQTLIKLGVGNSSVPVFGKGNEYDALCEIGPQP